MTADQLVLSLEVEKALTPHEIALAISMNYNSFLSARAGETKFGKDMLIKLRHLHAKFDAFSSRTFSE